jgi:RNA-directed DNA polymerase
VRYCDDFVMSLQCQHDARQMPLHLKERLTIFKLMLHEQKSSLIEFGKLVSELHRKRGAQWCATFTFLGFTHYCEWSRNEHFVVMRRTDHKRLTRKLKERWAEARRRMDTAIVLPWAFCPETLHILVCRAI